MVELIFLAGMLFVLGIGGFIADYIFPHIKPLAQYIDCLPMMADCEEETAPIFIKTETLIREEAS